MATFGLSESKAEKASGQRKRRINQSQERMRQEIMQGQRKGEKAD